MVVNSFFIDSKMIDDWKVRLSSLMSDSNHSIGWWAISKRLLNILQMDSLIHWSTSSNEDKLGLVKIKLADRANLFGKLSQSIWEMSTIPPMEEWMDGWKIGWRKEEIDAIVDHLSVKKNAIWLALFFAWTHT